MTISRLSSQAPDFYKYNETFNTGDDKAAMEFWVDDLVVVQGTGTDVFPLATLPNSTHPLVPPLYSRSGAAVFLSTCT